MGDADDKTKLGHILTETETLVCQLLDVVDEVERNLVEQLVGLRDSGEISILTPQLRDRLVAGAGVALWAESISGVHRTMEWWSVPLDGTDPRRLQVSFDPNSISYYDYINAEWFRSALDAEGPRCHRPLCRCSWHR